MQDDDNNNDGNDVGVNDVIDIENNNTFEFTRIRVHLRWYQSRKSIKDREKCVCIIQSVATHHHSQKIYKTKRLYIRSSILF